MKDILEKIKAQKRDLYIVIEHLSIIRYEVQNMTYTIHKLKKENAELKEKLAAYECPDKGSTK